jgi:hypothetical protein
MTQRPRRADDLAADLRADLAEAEGTRAAAPPPPGSPQAPTATPKAEPARPEVLAFSVETDLQLWPPSWARPGLRLGRDGLVVNAGPIRFGLGLRRRSR